MLDLFEKMDSILKRFIYAQPVVNLVITGIVIAALIPISFLGYKLYDVAWENAWHEVNEKHRLLAESMVPSVTMYVNNHQQVLEMLSKYLSNIQNDRQSSDSNALIKNILSTVKGFHSIAWVKKDGKLISQEFKEQYSPIGNIDFTKNEPFQKALKGNWAVANVITTPGSEESALLMTQH